MQGSAHSGCSKSAVCNEGAACTEDLAQRRIEATGPFKQMVMSRVLNGSPVTEQTVNAAGMSSSCPMAVQVFYIQAIPAELRPPWTVNYGLQLLLAPAMGWFAAATCQFMLLDLELPQALTCWVNCMHNASPVILGQLHA